ncbi:phosphotransferase family protein [Dactylosporangium sp. CS-047395]|uniref:phosphotransferase family protein n=1 Tax=Dactylosporangium sp. CS-047395 TaxID=3239936 RepID=UPI003D939F50
MKTLPDHPNLDHLRRQAKDLLAGLRDTDPGATLAGAQASIAEQYGFGGWAELKSEVARRQDHGAVAEPDLAQELADRFGLGTVTAPMRSVSRPDEIGRRWSLETDRGRWAPRTVDDVHPPTDGEDNARFQEAAALAGVTLPAPVRSIAGSVTETVKGKSWRVYSWMHSGPPLAAPVSAAVAGAVGRVLATIHGLRVPPPGLCPWSSVRFERRGWSELADLAADQRAGWAAELAQAVPTLRYLQTLAEDRAPIDEPVLCHNNLTPGNVRKGAGALVVTGWEHAAGLPPAWELSSALVNWTVQPGAGINVAAARALLDGYRARASAVPRLSFRGTATALQNYVAGQIDLALTATGDEDVRFAKRNVRHLLTHLPSRATFDELSALGGDRRWPPPTPVVQAT